MERERLGPAIGALYIGAALGFGYIIYKEVQKTIKDYKKDKYNLYSASYAFRGRDLNTR